MERVFICTPIVQNWAMEQCGCKSHVFMPYKAKPIIGAEKISYCLADEQKPKISYFSTCRCLRGICLFVSLLRCVQMHRISSRYYFYFTYFAFKVFSSLCL